MTLDEMKAFFAAEFPQSRVVIEAVAPGSARVRQQIGPEQLRPGATVSGPVLMATADSAMYAALLASIGPVALAVTTSLHINFLRKPRPDRDITAEAKLLKLGKRLAVGEVTIRSAGSDEPVAHATLTYSIPPHT
jgi:uncharacterized protein (TIGR00369 family)